MTKKTLQSWYNSNDITYSQKEAISKFGVGDYYPEYPLLDLKKLWYLDEIFERNKQRINIYCRIEKMIFFSTDWNNNLIIVVSNTEDGGWIANLIVYEMPMQSGNTSTEILEKITLLYEWIGKIDMNKVYEKERKLTQYSNPIYAFGQGRGVITLSDSIMVNYVRDYNDSDYPVVFWPLGIVKRIELPYSARYEPNKYIKPLDIVLIVNRKMVHACVYLGDKRVCHVLAERGGKVKIENWDAFINNVITADKILRYHPVVAFKKPSEIIRHIAKAVEGEEGYFSPGVKSRDGLFSIYGKVKGKSNNCENFANVCVLGMNFSELAEKNDKENVGGIYDIEESISGTSSTLDGLTYKSSVYDRIREIESYKNSVYYYPGIKMETRIEVQPKSWYRLN